MAKIDIISGFLGAGKNDSDPEIIKRSIKRRESRTDRE